MLASHLIGAATVVAGSIAAWWLASRGRPLGSMRESTIAGWLAFLSLGAVTCFMLVLASVFIMYIFVAFLNFLGVQQDAGRELELLIWVVLPLPIYLLVFALGAAIGRKRT